MREQHASNEKRKSCFAVLLSIDVLHVQHIEQPIAHPVKTISIPTLNHRLIIFINKDIVNV